MAVAAMTTLLLTFVLFTSTCEGSSIAKPLHDGPPTLMENSLVNATKQNITIVSEKDDSKRTRQRFMISAETASKQQKADQENTFDHLILYKRHLSKRHMSRSQLNSVLRYIRVLQYRRLLNKTTKFNSPMFIGK